MNSIDFLFYHLMVGLKYFITLIILITFWRFNKDCKSFVNVAQEDKLLFILIDFIKNILNLGLYFVSGSLVVYFWSFIPYLEQFTQCLNFFV